jgi:hypothetical protein
MNNDTINKTPNDPAPAWPARVGGALVLLGTALSMVLRDWQAEVAMGAALVGFVLVLVRWRKPE